MAGPAGQSGLPALTAVAAAGRSARGPAPTLPRSTEVPSARARPSRRLPAPPCAQVRPQARWHRTRAQPCLLCCGVTESGPLTSPLLGLSWDPWLADPAGPGAVTSDLLFHPVLWERRRQKLLGVGSLPSGLGVLRGSPQARVPEAPGVSTCAPALDCSAHLAADPRLAAVLFSLCLALYPHQLVCVLCLWWRVCVNVWCFSPGFVPLLNPVRVCVGDRMCVSGAAFAHLSSLTLIWPVARFLRTACVCLGLLFPCRTLCVRARLCCARVTVCAGTRACPRPHGPHAVSPQSTAGGRSGASGQPVAPSVRTGAAASAWRPHPRTEAGTAAGPCSTPRTALMGCACKVSLQRAGPRVVALEPEKPPAQPPWPGLQ